MSSTPFLVVGGNIATGKSTLVEALGRSLGLSVFPERWRDNPWLTGTDRNELASQLWFLAGSARDSLSIAEGAGGVLERCPQEHALVFAADYLSNSDARLHDDIYLLLDGFLPNPDLLIYLEGSPETLLRRIRDRGRTEELDMTLDRLIRLDQRYKAFVSQWERCPIIRIDTELADLRVEAQLTATIAMIEKAIP